VATPNRDQILANVRTTLAGMSVVGGYHFNLSAGQILSVMRAGSEIGGNTMPVLCVFSAKSGTPAPLYFPFSITEEYLDIVILGHVAVSETDDGTDREAQISALEDDIRLALKQDPSRGGWGIDTIKIQAPVTEEGVPDKTGTNRSIASFSVAYRVTYYPDG
jgi:hypothetical protein